jgi:hypothetical protein
MGKQDRDLERGSTAFRAAADVMIRVSINENRLITIKNNKQKDAEEFENITLHLRQVHLAGECGGEATSCVLVQPSGASRVPQDCLPERLRKVLMILGSSSQETATTPEWMSATGLNERTFHARRRELQQKGYIALGDGVNRGVYRITEKGRKALGPATARELQTA